MNASDPRKVVVVVSDFKFLNRNFNNLYYQLRVNGKYQGEVLVITSKLTPTFLIKSIRKKHNVKVVRFKKIKFDQKTEFELNNIQTFDDPNRNKTKKFQWHKLHLFDEYIKNWEYVFYLDINMNVHHDINKILDVSPQNHFMARADAFPDYNRDLKTQFDQTHPLFENLNQKYKLGVRDYFQTGVMYFDTNIIDKNTKDEIINLVKKYPITKTNEQGVLNIYFYLEKKLYKELPSEIDGFFTYYYWMVSDKKIIITKQLIEQYK